LTAQRRGKRTGPGRSPSCGVARRRQGRPLRMRKRSPPVATACCGARFLWPRDVHCSSRMGGARPRRASHGSIVVRSPMVISSGSLLSPSDDPPWLSCPGSSDLGARDERHLPRRHCRRPERHRCRRRGRRDRATVHQTAWDQNSAQWSRRCQFLARHVDGWGQ
jgi:hypothetical protein